MQYNRPESERLLKILIIGNSGVGKSCMLMRYVENSFTTAFYNTIGVDFKMKNVEVDGRKVRMQVWDTAGQDRFRTITSTYYKGAHGIMLVYDVTDKESFDSLKFWLQEVQKYAHENVDKLVVANKSDQIQKRKVSYDEGYGFAKMHGLQFVQVSAMSSTNIAQAFDILARRVLKRLDSTGVNVQKLPQTQLQSKKQKQTSNNTCCGG